MVLCRVDIMWDISSLLCVYLIFIFLPPFIFCCYSLGVGFIALVYLVLDLGLRLKTSSQRTL